MNISIKNTKNQNAIRNIAGIKPIIDVLGNDDPEIREVIYASWYKKCVIFLN